MAGRPPWQADNSAYIPVQFARRTFAPSRHSPPTYMPTPPTSHLVPPPPPPPPPKILSTQPTQYAPLGPTPQARKKIAWSPAVRSYVQRSFAPEAAMPAVSRQEMEVKLKQVITDATQTGRLESTNWDHMLLPQQLIIEERNRPAQPSPITPSWHAPAVVPVAPVPPSPPEQLRKRKSSEMTLDREASPHPPPWRTNGTQMSFEDRLTYVASADKRQKLDHMGKNASKFDSSLETRKKRFEDTGSGSHSPQRHNGIHNGQPLVAENAGPVVGRSQKLEKNYFRLTSAPNPDDVRPLEVLRKTLELLKKKWKTDSNYAYICDQFKSLRQDLTVQHIKNDFTINVYEMHARIALEKGDLGEYNQCQTQLRSLYQQNLGGHPTEFKAYRILYFIHTCNRTDMTDVLSDLTPADKTDPAIKNALETRSALALGNYHRFFKLYLTVPHMGAYLMDMFIVRERLAALASICKTYKPDVRIRFVTEELAFEHDEETARFILAYAAPEVLQEREGDVRFLTGKAGMIFENAKAAAFKSVDIKGQI